MSALIEIKNISVNATVTINVEGVKSSAGAGLSGLMAALLDSLSVAGNDEVDPAATGEVESPLPEINPDLVTPADAAPAEQTEVNVALDKADAEDEAEYGDTPPAVDLQGQILEFITSDSRYTLRSVDAIREKFGPNGVMVADSMLRAGILGAKRRRADKVVLYFKATPASGNLKRDIIAFLNSDSRYHFRTEAAIRKVFASAGAGAVSLALNEMDATGLVGTKKRRRDRATLYASKVAASFFDVPEAAPVEAVATETAVPAAPELTVEAVRDFVGGNPKYSSRSESAIVNNFGDFSTETVTDKLKEMVEDGDLGTLRRRSDGATLYTLA